METNEILTRLGHGTSESDSEAIRGAIRRSGILTPELLQMMEDLAAEAELPLQNYIDPRYVIPDLGKLRETEDHIPLLQLCLLPERRLNAYFGEILDSKLDRALAATSGGDTSGITLLIEDENACEDVRICGLRALVRLADSDEASREIVVDALQDLSCSLVDIPCPLWEELAYSALFLAESELGHEVLSAWRDGLIEGDWSEVEDRLVCRGKTTNILLWDEESGPYVDDDWFEPDDSDDSEDGW